MDDSSQEAITTYDSVDQIIRDLENAPNTIPSEAIRAARERRDEIIPKLIEVIRKEAARSPEDDEWAVSSGPFYALLLLWEFQAKEALPAILEAVSLHDENSYDLFGDLITECLDRVLATLGGEASELFEAMAADPSLDKYVRAQAASALVLLVRDGRLERIDVVRKLDAILRQSIDNDRGEDAAFMIMAMSPLAPVEALPTIREAFNEGLINPFLTRLPDIEDAIATGPAALERLPTTHTEDCTTVISDWMSFSDELPEGARDFLDGESGKLDGPSLMDDFHPVGETHIDEIGTIRYEGRPVGRNEPCPCGSGKKYKKCCGKPGD